MGKRTKKQPALPGRAQVIEVFRSKFGRDLNMSELGAILGGLRMLQATLRPRSAKFPLPTVDDIYDLITDGGYQEALTAKDIDNLCEELNAADRIEVVP